MRNTRVRSHRRSNGGEKVYKFKKDNRIYSVKAKSMSSALDKINRLYRTNLTARDSLTNKSVKVKTHSRKVKSKVNSPVKVGSLWYTSWGYDQTNYDYIIVVSVSDTGKSAMCRRAGWDKGGNDYVGVVSQKPVRRPFGDKFRLLIKRSEYGDKNIYLVGSYPYGHSGTGYKRLGHFWKVEPGDTFEETAPGWGH